jgi:pimeloyl-ACP methyl ester carboxylesterase
MSLMSGTRWSLEHGMVVRRIGTGPRVVWIHGLGESSVSFEASLPRLPGYTHVLVDLPGCGRSPWPEAAASLVDTADAIASWLASDPPAVLIGHSLGGVFATLVAERTPVRGVIDIDGNLTRGDCTFSAAAAAYSDAEFVARGFDEMRATIYADGATRADLRGYHAALTFASPHVFHRHAGELVELSMTGTLAARLAALGDKALFITGATDGICPDSRALLVAHAVPWIGIEGAGHWVYVDQPEAFTAAVARFLQAV